MGFDAQKMKFFSSKKVNFIKKKFKFRDNSTEFARLEKGECCIELLILLLPLLAAAFPALGAAGFASIFDWDEIFGDFFD